MCEQHKADSPQYRSYRTRRELDKIPAHIVGITRNMPRYRGIQILQAPSSHNRIESEDNSGAQDTEQSHSLPWFSARHLMIGSGSIGCRVTTNDKLIHHARKAEQEDKQYIYEDEGRTSILTCHIWESPHIAKTYCRSCRGEDYT